MVSNIEEPPVRNLKIFLAVVAATTVLAGFAWLGYALYGKFHRPAASPFSAIPGNTALIIQLNGAGNLLGELDRSNLVWRAMLQFPGIDRIRDELHYVDSAGKKNEEVSKIFREQNILVSVTLSGRNSFGALYLGILPGGDPEAGILDFIGRLSKGKAILTSSPYSTTQLHRLQWGSGREAFYFSVMKGVFMGSFHADLVKRAVDRLSLNTPMETSSGFRKVLASAGRKVDANIYVNYRFFSLVLSRITLDENLPDLLRFSNFADWSGLDLIIKKDELLFNGTTVASDSNQHFLALFSDQKPQVSDIAAIVPADAYYLTTYGWSDPARFCQRYRNRASRDETYTGEQGSVISIIDRYQLNVSEYYLPWIEREACIFFVRSAGTRDEGRYLAFHTADTALARGSLFALADTLGIRCDSITFKGQRIYRIPLPAFIPALFGEQFGKAGTGCFTFLGGSIVFASTPPMIETVIEAYRQGNTLANRREYTDFVSNLSDRFNLFTYYNTDKAIHALKSQLKEELTGQLGTLTDTLRKFESVAFQYSNTDGQFYSNILLRYDPNLGREGPLQWQAVLDTTVASQPVILTLPETGSNTVFTTDLAGNLYRISREGRIEWKLHIMGNILGKIEAIRMPGTDSTLLVFNTDTHLYLLRTDGTHAPSFPMRFPLKATSGITITDWDGNRQYNILVAFQDNRLYCFGMDGKAAYGWARPKLGETINEPVTSFTAGRKDYILARDAAGGHAILDRNGNSQFTVKPQFTLAAHSRFHLNRTARKGLFLTTGPDGKVIFIGPDGRTSAVTLNHFSGQHRFFYQDITGNGSPEFIFSDRNSIYYYNRNYKLIYSYAFRREITSPPFLVHGSNGKVMVGYVVPETNELFLFDRHGYREIEAGIRGNTPFEIGPLDNDTVLSLVVGAGKTVKAYRLSDR